MNEASLCRRLGGGTDPSLMSLRRRAEEREHYETSPFILLSLCRCAHPRVLLSCDGLVLQAGDSLCCSSLPPPVIPQPPTRDLPQPWSCPAQPRLFLLRGLWPQPAKCHTHALAHRQRRPLIRVHVCIWVSIA